MDRKEWSMKKQEVQKTQETQKIFLPVGGIVEITHDKEHRPKVRVYDNDNDGYKDDSKENIIKDNKKKVNHLIHLNEILGFDENGF